LGMNPQAGNDTFTIFTVGQRDADNDGIQNSEDTCPFVPNKGDPTMLNSGDADGDGLDAACDPNDDPINRGSNTDQDADGYLNRQDNCPLVPNGQESKDQPTGNQNDEDFDGIGDVCDTAPQTPDGELLVKTLTADITIGAGGAGALRDRRRPPEADAGDGACAPSTSDGAGSSRAALPSLAAGL